MLPDGSIGWDGPSCKLAMHALNLCKCGLRTGSKHALPAYAIGLPQMHETYESTHAQAQTGGA